MSEQTQSSTNTALKIVASVVAFAMISVATIFITLIFAIGTLIQRYNPLCLSVGMVVTPVGQIVNGARAVGDFLFGDDDLDHFIEAVENSAVIHQVGKSMASQGITDEDVVFALQVAWQESKVRNLGHLGEQNDHNSIGLFQQQYGMAQNGEEYWGTAAQLHNPVYASQRFFQEVLKFPDRAGMYAADSDRLELALDIQRPSRAAYTSEGNNFISWRDEAEDLFEMIEQNNDRPETDHETSIAVIGDSITVAANSYMFDDLAAAGYTDIRIDAQGARSTGIDAEENRVPTTSGDRPTLTDSNQPLVSGVTAIRNMRAGGFDPQDWMILLGTNDVAGVSTDPVKGEADARRIIERIQNELGPEKRVLWLTIWNSKIPEKAAVFNQTLIKMTAEHENLFVGDWASLVDQNPDWNVDHVHYSTEGSKQRSSFLGKVVGALSHVPGVSQVISAINVGSSLLDGCYFNGSSFNNQVITNDVVGENTPLDTVSNPGLAEAAVNFEQWVGYEIQYGAARSNWAHMKGNFGHGNKEQWFSQLSLGPAYRSMDCSGFMNLVLWMAYGIDYTGCSFSYKNVVIDGQDMTVPVMEGQITASLLQPGDFIISDNNPCGAGGNINHIVMVLGVSGSVITTAESSPSSGYAVRQVEVSEMNAEWPNPVVSRWVGPGAVVVQTEPVDVGAVTTTTSP